MKKSKVKYIALAAICVVIVAAGISLNSNVFGRFEQGTVAVPGGGNNISGRGTADNPFVILEVVPDKGEDNIWWESTEAYGAEFDELQVMRWGATTAMSQYNDSILKNQDLLHNIEAVNKLVAEGVVTAGNLKTETHSKLSSFAADRQKYVKKGGYTYFRKATPSDTGQKYALVLIDLDRDYNYASGYYGFGSNGVTKRYKDTTVGSTSYMVYVAQNAAWGYYNSERGYIRTKKAAFVPEGDPILNGVSPVYYVLDYSASKPSGTGFDDIKPSSVNESGYYVFEDYVRNKNGDRYAGYYFEEMVTADYILFEYNQYYTETYYESLTCTNKFVSKVIKPAIGLHGISEANYVVDVITISGRDLRDNHSLIDRADFIVIEANRNALGGYYDSADIDNATLFKLYSKVSGYHLYGAAECPVLINNRILTNQSQGGSEITLARPYADDQHVDPLNNIKVFNNSMFKFATMLSALDDDDLVTYYFKDSGLPRINLTNGKIYWEDWKRSYSGNYQYNGEQSSAAWNNDILKPVEYIYSSSYVSSSGWRSESSETVVEEEFYVFKDNLGESDYSVKKSLFSESTTYQISYKNYYTCDELFNYAGYYNNLSSRKVSTLKVMEFLLNKRNTSVTGTPTPAPSGGTATNTPTPTNVVTGPATPSPTPAPVRTSVRILEIEPYRSFIPETGGSGTYSNWTKIVKALYGEDKDFELTQMSTNEFIVNNVDLDNNFDIIYFGLNASGNYYNNVYKFIQNDSSFANTLVYSHVGPAAWIPYSRVGGLKGGLAADTWNGNNVKTRLAGNDITYLKETQIKSFIDASGLVVFGTGFIKNNAIDSSKIDTSTWIYDLSNLILANGNGVFLDKTINTSTAKSKLSSKYCRIEYEQIPAIYDSEVGGLTAADYINGSDPLNRNLEFKFTIRDVATIRDPLKYNIHLYVDLNADGRFNSYEAEELVGFTIYDLTFGEYVQSGAPLLSGHSYTLKRDVSELVGVIPWCLEIVRINDAGKELGISDSIEGYSAVQARTDEKETIRVLQIYHGVGDDSTPLGGNKSSNYTSYLLPTTSDLINAATRLDSSFNLSSYIFNPTNHVSEVGERIVIDYRLTTEKYDLGKLYNYFHGLITQSNLYNTDMLMYDTSGKKYYFGTEHSGTARSGATRLSNTNSSGNNLYGVTAEFYVLFKQLNEFNVYTDRMSWKAYENYVATAGNSLLKDYDMIILGFGDGYVDINNDGCMELRKFINAGKTVLFTHDNTSYLNVDPSLTKSQLQALGADSSLYNDLQSAKSSGSFRNNMFFYGYSINKFFRSTLALDRYNIYGNNGSTADGSNGYRADKAMLGGTERTDSNQGFQDAVNNSQSNNTLTTSNLTTTRVIRVNRGTVTEYPYTLPEKIDISTTHQQYYELDMENPNVVVWYSLYSESSTNNYNSNKNDARNYYYIYNVGNVTYTGAGHSLGKASEIVNELRLFVNTVVAAYRASGAPVTTLITNDDRTSNDDTDYLYIDFDSNDTEVALGEGIEGNKGAQTKKVFFKVENNGIVKPDNIVITYEMYDPETDTWVEHSDWVTQNKADNATCGTATIGTVTGTLVQLKNEYYFKVPLNLIAESSSMKIRLTTTIEYKSETGDESTILSNEKIVTLLRRGFFDLD